MNTGFASDRSARTASEAHLLPRPLALPTRSLFKSAVFCALFLGPALTATAASVAGVSFTATTSAHSDTINRMIGWQFTVGTNPIEVTSLGFQDYQENGLLYSHEVGIWRLSDEQLVATAVVPAGTSGTLESFFRYASLSSPVPLTSGTAYVIAAFDNGRDPHVWDVAKGGFPNMEVTGFAVDSAIALGDPGTAYGGGASSFGFPGGGTIGDVRSALLGPNLHYNVVPEPTAALLALITTLTTLCLRSRPR